MAVIAEFTADANGFSFGTALYGGGAEIRIERVVPMTTSVLPFVWVKGGDRDALEARVRDSPHVDSLTQLVDVEDSVLYQIDWQMEEECLIQGIVETSAVVLKAHGSGETWSFRLLFPNHKRLASFYQYVQEGGIDIDAVRIYTLIEEFDESRRLGLTREQYEALKVAVESGHFDTPSKVTLSELAEEFNISPQAFSQRVRRANEKVLRAVLASDAVGESDFEVP